MYEEFFGLQDSPFSIAPNPRYLYMTPKHREALAHLVYGVRSGGGFVLLTGEVGTGKTTICRCFLQQVPEHVDVAFIFNPKVTVEELLASICDELGIAYYNDQVSVKDYVDYLNAYLLDAHAEGKKTILIIDEAQNLEPEVLEQLRLLTNLETDREKLLQIILIGQPELQDIFERQELRQLAQRITARFHLGNLTEEETAAYVEHRLAVAGNQRPIFNDKALKRLHQISGGIPRLINVICDRALLGAYALNAALVDKDVIEQAAKEVLGERSNKLSPQRQQRTWIAAASILVALLGAVFVAAQFSGPRVDTTEQSVASTEVSIPELPQLVNALALPEAASESGVEELTLEPNLVPDQLASPAAIEPDYNYQSENSSNEQIQLALLDSRNETSLNTASAISDDSQVVNKTAFQWPALASTKSLYAAYEHLFQLWQVGYDPAKNGGDPCTYARSNQLECLQRKGSFEQVLELNRPSVLKVFPQPGKHLYVLLTAINENQVEVKMGDQFYLIPRDELLSIWKGQYTLMWKTPPNYYGQIKPDSIGPVVKWLKRSISQINNESINQNPSGIYDQSLKDKIESFQSGAGLIADGIVGEKTFIALNNRLYPELPSLAGGVMQNVSGNDTALGNGNGVNQQELNNEGAN